ncbi:MAG: metallophosphoesterase [Candidatus Alcyoniella australis]|nr:metallophosphoesterase [Candidatus Alcyoniella australis]
MFRLKLLCVLICLASVLVIAPAQARVVKAPYLQYVTQDAVSILWETSVAQQDRIEWGPSEALGNTLEESVAYKYHEQRIDGLEPETLYYYRAIVEGVQGEIKSFVTAPDACSPFSFVLFGDTRSQHLPHSKNIERILDVSADFVINTGDIIDSEESQITNEVRWTEHFQIEAELLDEVPLFPVMGNHDDGTQQIWHRIFALPGNELYYQFDWGNSRFIVCDTQQPILDGSEQYAWLVNALADAYDDPDVQHVFVSFHIPPYSHAGHESNPLLIAALTPLFKEYEVQAVLNGHSHNFQHLEADGVRYFISGGGGASLQCEEHGIPQMLEYSCMHHYIVITIDGPLVTLEVYDALTNSRIYSTFWMDDMGKDPCAGDDDDQMPDDDDADDDDDDSGDDHFGGADDDDDDESCCGRL